MREAYITYRGRYDISRQYQNQILPLRATIDEQVLLEYPRLRVGLAKATDNRRS